MAVMLRREWPGGWFAAMQDSEQASVDLRAVDIRPKRGPSWHGLSFNLLLL